MSTFTKFQGPTARSKRKTREEWAEIWFHKLADFHGVKDRKGWRFTRGDVIGYLRFRRDQGVPAKKRRMIVQGLITYRNVFLRSNAPKLEDIRTKLAEIAVRESAEQLDGDLIEEVVEKINQREPDVIREMRCHLRRNRLAPRTEKAYVNWVKRFMRVRGISTRKHFDSITVKNVEAFLTDLAVDGNVAAKTQEQAFYSFKYLFEHILQRPMDDVNALRSDKPQMIPTVMSKDEVASVLSLLPQRYLLIGQLLYGCGLRISECLRLRIRDFDFDQGVIRIFDSKGNSSRLVPLPESLVDALMQKIQWRREIHLRDLAEGRASVWLPHALARKYPNAPQEFCWQFLFASDRFSRDPRTGAFHRHHIHRDTFPDHLRGAVRKLELDKPVTCHTFRHSYATHLLSDGVDIRTIQQLLGHKDVSTTMIYTHVMNRSDVVAFSPLDRLVSVKQENETRPQRGSVQEDDRVPAILLDGTSEFGTSEFGTSGFACATQENYSVAKQKFFAATGSETQVGRDRPWGIGRLFTSLLSRLA